MGCLSDLVKLTIIIFAFIGFVAVGGLDFIKESRFVQNSPDVQNFIEKVRIKNKEIGPFNFKDTKSKADFSKIPKNKYKIEYQGGLWSTKSVLASSKDSYQSMIYINTEGILNTSKEEFSKYSERETVELLGRIFSYQRMKLSNYEIIKKGEMRLLSQNAPYVRYKATMQNGPYEMMYGMIAMAQEPDGQNVLLVSFSFDQPFNQDEAQRFYNSIEFKKNE